MMRRKLFGFTMAEERRLERAVAPPPSWKPARPIAASGGHRNDKPPLALVGSVGRGTALKNADGPDLGRCSSGGRRQAEAPAARRAGAFVAKGLGARPSWLALPVRARLLLRLLLPRSQRDRPPDGLALPGRGRGSAAPRWRVATVTPSPPSPPSGSPAPGATG